MPLLIVSCMNPKHALRSCMHQIHCAVQCTLQDVSAIEDVLNVALALEMLSGQETARKALHLSAT